MRVIIAPENYKIQDDEVSVFLAGGITGCDNWQDDVIQRLKEIDDKERKEGREGLDKLVLFNPRRENFPINDRTETWNQIEWEFNALERCNIFSMYFCSGDSDQPICMYELGRNVLRMQMKYDKDWWKRIIVSVESGYKREGDVVTQFNFAIGRKNDELDLFVKSSEDKRILRENCVKEIVWKYERINGKISEG